MLEPLTTVHRSDQRGCGGSDESPEYPMARSVAGHRERMRRMTAGQQRRLAGLEQQPDRSPAEEVEFRALSWSTDSPTRGRTRPGCVLLVGQDVMRVSVHPCRCGFAAGRPGGGSTSCSVCC